MPNKIITVRARPDIASWEYIWDRDKIDPHPDRIVKSITEHQELVHRDYLESADRLIASQELSRQIISGDLADISDQLSSMTDVFQFGLGHLNNAIYDLKASFDWAAEKAIWHLAEINGKLARPRHTQAMEYRQNGVYALNNEWHDDAKRDFLKAEEYYPYDFVVHQYLGDILLWKSNDRQKAFEYYQKAAKYAEPHSKEVASWAKLHLALIKYFCKEFPEAAKLADEAIKLFPSAEANYQTAHYRLLARYETKYIIPLLEIAIRKDPSYFLKIDASQKSFEEDFRKIQRPLNELKKKMFNEARQEALAKIEECRSWLNRLRDDGAPSLTPVTEAAHEKTRLSFNKAIEMFNRESYLDFRLTIEFCD